MLEEQALTGAGHVSPRDPGNRICYQFTGCHVRSLRMERQPAPVDHLDRARGKHHDGQAELESGGGKGGTGKLAAYGATGSEFQ